MAWFTRADTQKTPSNRKISAKRPGKPAGTGDSPPGSGGGFFTWRTQASSLTGVEVERYRRRVAQAAPRSEDVELELTTALALAQRIRSEDLEVRDADSRLKYVFDCLLSRVPKLIEARSERIQLQFDIYRRRGRFSRALARLSQQSLSAVVLAALLASLIAWALFALFIQLALNFHLGDSTLLTDIFFMHGRPLAVISSAAFLGGVISIATRLRDFSRVTDLDPIMMFWTVMLKPLIGVVLSWFILAALAGDIMSFGFLGNNPLALEADNEAAELPDKVMYVLWVLGFLSGFSERFAWDFIDRAQGVAAGGLSGRRASAPGAVDTTSYVRRNRSAGATAATAAKKAAKAAKRAAKKAAPKRGAKRAR
jgi:hypothetical protein